MIQRNGAKRLTTHTQTFTTISRRTNPLASLSSSPKSHRYFRDHQALCHFIESCKLSSDYKTAIQIHTSIIKSGYETYPSVIASLLSAYVHFGHLNLAHQFLDEVFCWNFDLVRMNLLLENLMRIRGYDMAKKVFYKMPIRDVVTWNSMIGGYVRNARYGEALRSFQNMLSLNVEPDKFTFASIITGCARLGVLNHGLWVHGLMIEKNIERNFILNASLIDMYMKCGRIQTANEVFGSIERNDVCVWNAMINGLAVHGLALDAIALFSRMEFENVLPDSITFIGILTACSHCGLVEEGRKHFDLMRSHYSIRPQLEHFGAMVDLFGRAGFLEEAYAMIEVMPMEPDVVIWRTLLSACRTHKKPELGEVAVANISRLKSGDYVLLSNTYCSLNRWDSAERVREMMKRTGVRKNRGKSWVELAGVVRQFKAGDRSHPETGAVYKVLDGLIKRTKLEGYMSSTELVLMDVSEEEKEENLNHHSEKLALAYGILKTCPGTDIRISKNLRICYDCHTWIKLVARLLSRVIIVRDRIRFHRFEGGLCSCGDYW
ncbi:PPR domain-containing protein/PPR_2 domain-containing protein/PPR_3 domain-containing protein/DYW_deaminase domain-containing protein [Cephalotus follicularis]|uniref:PPR domain-containing protein/PPR_2 domain-containing protein/PPR_3 domain-containing protein/DYW_deaminase domain-containing protein n=1 Tax=Cephalotus follicularis TaxID=3775 RepID=A0A1Q3ATN7_CEPFO|nr:PPR domain-containing protein/PPR_2 domain-containing protein/PPR_3 domain-containing protein/DYW_deaminase domain-containing protein [Cephalotus follicularis]